LLERKLRRVRQNLAPVRRAETAMWNAAMRLAQPERNPAVPAVKLKRMRAPLARTEVARAEYLRQPAPGEPMQPMGRVGLAKAG